MKNPLFILFLFIFTLPVFAQRLVTVGVVPFETSGDDLAAGFAADVTRQVIAELMSYGTINVLSEDQAVNADYVVRGQVARQDTQIVLSATTSEGRSGRVLNTSRAQGLNLAVISIASFCAQIVEHISLPNYLLGRWRSTIDTIDGPLTSILEFHADRTVWVEQYDTWEHHGTNSLRYQAIGTGSYTYAGYVRRTVNIGNREIRTDATVSISLNLEDALPRFSYINARGLRVLFNDDRSSFELVYGDLPCGENHSGTSVFPTRHVSYTRFTKIN
jgi:TolB-like protein